MNELNHPISSILTKSEMNLLRGHGALAIGLDIAHYRDHQRLYIRKMLCHDRGNNEQSDDLGRVR